MLRIRIDTASAEIIENDLITAGRKGLECQFNFSSDWDDLAKTVVVIGAAQRDVALVGDTMVLPGECLAKAQFPLKIGVYGANAAGNIVIPTIWANFGKVLPGAKPSDIPPDELTPDVVAQIQEAAGNALYLARNVQNMADSGELDGDAATISVGTTTTLPAGSPATVENIGTSSEAVFNFGIPKGDKGDKGNPGAGFPAGGMKDNVLRKLSDDDYDTGWAYPSDMLSDDTKTALLQLAQKVAYIDAQGATYYQALYDALYPPKVLLYITAIYTQSGTVYDDDSLDSLKDDLLVKAKYDDNTEPYVTNYTLSGTLTAGTSTVTVTYNGKTTTFTVTVTARPTLSSVSAVYTQGGTVYDTDTLDSLKTDLVVTATYSDSSTATVAAADYTLSGTLTVGTSTITVSYGGKTATFDVVVSLGDLLYALPSPVTFTGSNYVDTGVKLLETDQDFTICTEFTNGVFTYNSLVFDCRNTLNPKYGVMLFTRQQNYYALSGMTSTYPDNTYLATEGKTLKLVIRHKVSDNSWSIDGLVDGVRQAQTSVTTSKTISTVSSELRIGAPNDNGTGAAWHGTVSIFNIHSRCISDQDVTAWLGA